MSVQPFERPPAKSLDEVDTHLRYAQGSLKDIKEALDTVVARLPLLATKTDIETLHDKFSEYAKLTEVESRIAALKVEIQRQSVPSTIERAATMIQKIGAAAAVLGGAFLLGHEFLTRLGK